MKDKIKTNSFEELNVKKNVHDFDVKASIFNVPTSISSINKLIPQQPPFVMVEKLLFCDEITTKTSFTIKNDNIFLENEFFSQSGIVENVAQTCAARMGYLGDNQDIKIGMIGAVSNFEFFYLPKINDEVFTEIVVDTEIGNVVLLNATVVCNEKTVATGKMKVVLTDKTSVAGNGRENKA